MKPLVGLLLVLSGLVLVAPPVYEVLSYIEYNNIPIVPVTLGAASVSIGLYFLIAKRGRRTPKSGVWEG